MEPKDITIQCPEGYEYYIENNTIKFKRKEVTWEDIKSRLSEFWKNMLLNAECANLEVYNYFKLKAIADYLNNEWKLESNDTIHYEISVIETGRPRPFKCSNATIGAVCFKDFKSCEEAIKIMGEGIKYLF